MWSIIAIPYLMKREVVKKVKVFKKVTLRVENLKIELLLIFLKSSFWNNQWSFFPNSCFALSLRLVTYVFIWFY